jgi:allantoinase
MSDFDLALSGTIVLPDKIIDSGFVAVREGKIALVGEGAAPAARERHELGEALILPGAIDGQTHSLSQKDQEDFIWSTRSAAAGGVTTIVDMPYDEGNLVCSAQAVRQKVAHAEEQARVDFALYGTINPEEGAGRILEQVDAVQVFDLRHRSGALSPHSASPAGGVLRRDCSNRADRWRPQRGR